MCSASVFAQEQKSEEANSLTTNQTFERELQGNQTHKYRIVLQANECLEVKAEQKGIDVVIRLFDSEQKQLFEKDSPNGTQGFEELLFIANKAGNYEIYITALEKEAKSGNYTLKWNLRNPTGKDYEVVGSTYHELKQYDHALELYDKALNIWRQLSDKQNESRLLARIGYLYSLVLKQYEKAVQFNERGLAIARELKDRKLESVFLSAIGRIYSDELKQYEKAKSYFDQSLIILREIKDPKFEAQILYEFGRLHKNVEQYEKAVQYFLQSLKLFQESRDYKTPDAFMDRPTGPIMQISSIYERSHQSEKADEIIEQTLAILRKHNDKRQEIMVLSRLSNEIMNEYVIGSNQARAVRYLERCLILLREVGDKRGEANLLSNTAFSYQVSQKKYGKALQYFEKALSIAEEIKDLTMQIYVLEKMGKLYFGLKNVEKAHEYYERIANIVAQNNSTKLLKYDSTFYNLAKTYLILKQYDKSIEFYNKAVDLDIFKKGSLGAKLSFAASVYKEQKQYHKATELLEQALDFYKKKAPGSFEEREALYQLGELYVEQKLIDKATEYFKLSRYSSNNLIKLYIELKQYDKAKSYVENSIDSILKYPNFASKADIFSLAVDLYQALNNPQLAIYYGKQQINSYQAERTEIKDFDKDTQLKFIQDKEPAYRHLANLLISESRFPEAQAVLDLLKEEEFKQIVRSSSGEPISTLPYSKTEEEALKIVDKLAAIELELSKLKAKQKKSLTTDESKRLSEIESIEIPAANKALRQSIESLSTVTPDVKNKLDLKLNDNIQNILPALGNNVVALYTVIGKTSANEMAENKLANNKTNVGWILLITSETRKAYPIDTTDLEQTVFKFRESLRSPLYDPKPLAEELYKKLFRQTSPKQTRTLEQDLEEILGKHKDKTLMWSLDGVLRYVPMAALYDGKNYLVEKYRNTVFNTASLGTLSASTKQDWEVVGLGVSTEGTVKSTDGRMLRFSALAGSDAELNSIVKEKNRTDDKDGIFPGTLKINKEFTKEALFEGARTKAPVIHISSHFWYNPTKEETSFLLLGNGEKLEITEFQDYPNLFRDVDFLSLSACDTATGSGVNGSNNNNSVEKESNGKEIEGLAFAAQKLGAKSVMASLWAVNDRGTKELMLKFYKIRKQQPELSKAEALRQAQLSLLNGTIKSDETETEGRSLELVKVESGLSRYKKDAARPFGHPYYWSPFILIGNWK